MSKRILLGRITRPHGIKGEVRVAFFGDRPEILNGPLWLSSHSGQARPLRVLAWRVQQEQLILALQGVEDRNQAEALRNAEILVAEADMPPPGEDELYLHQLMGLEVHQACPPRLLGVLENVIFPAGQELWSIISPDGKEILFPAVAEFVEDIDLDAGRIVVNPPEGLLDLYLSEN